MPQIGELMPTRLSFKTRLLIYSGIILAFIASSFFWGSPGQWLNMRQVRREFDSVKAELAGDPRFADLHMVQSTADLGRQAAIRGRVPDQASLEYLKSVVKRRMSPRFKVGISVKVGEDPPAPMFDEQDKR